MVALLLFLFLLLLLLVVVVVVVLTYEGQKTLLDHFNFSHLPLSVLKTLNEN